MKPRTAENPQTTQPKKKTTNQNYTPPPPPKKATNCPTTNKFWVEVKIFTMHNCLSPLTENIAKSRRGSRTQCCNPPHHDPQLAQQTRLRLPNPETEGINRKPLMFQFKLQDPWYFVPASSFVLMLMWWQHRFEYQQQIQLSPREISHYWNQIWYL